MAGALALDAVVEPAGVLLVDAAVSVLGEADDSDFVDSVFDESDFDPRLSFL